MYNCSISVRYLISFASNSLTVQLHCLDLCNHNVFQLITGKIVFSKMKIAKFKFKEATRPFNYANRGPEDHVIFGEKYLILSCQAYRLSPVSYIGI